MSLSARFMYLILLLVLASPRMLADTYYTETEPNKEIQKRYTREDVYGKKVITVYAFNNTGYYAFVSKGVSTIINLPYKIKEVIDNPANGILNISKGHVGAKYFFMKPNPSQEVNATGLKTDFHIICENGFRILLNVEIIPMSRAGMANKIITFFDGAVKKKEEMIYTKQRFYEQKEAFKSELENKKSLISDIFFKPIRKFPIEEPLRHEGLLLTLMNIFSVQNRLYFNVRLIGDDTGILTKDAITLTLQNFDNFIVSEVQNIKTTYAPVEVIQFKQEEVKHVSIVFEIDQLSPLFYSTLRIGEHIQFDRRKINLEHAQLQQNLFESEF